ncbi:MAG TPA: DUF6491 family protein [Caulobacteraceae bacterium]|nr:DUF6491 family protein [Caulobacteraceae bacterium]
MNRTLFALLGGAVLSISLVAASAPAQPKDRQSECFPQREIDSWASQDQRTVNLRVGFNRYYQLKLFSPCLDLDFSQAIGMRSRGSDWICAGENNDVEIFTRSMAGRQRCLVTSVRRLTPAEVAALPRGAKP